MRTSWGHVGAARNVQMQQPRWQRLLPRRLLLRLAGQLQAQALHARGACQQPSARRANGCLLLLLWLLLRCCLLCLAAGRRCIRGSGARWCARLAA